MAVTKYRHETFVRAPLTEALIDIRTTPLDPGAFDTLDSYTSRIADRFPHKEDRTEIKVEARIDRSMGSSQSLQHSQQRLGYVCFSQQRDKAVQARLNGFTLSKLKPYENWTKLRDESRELWALYREAVNPQTVVRLAVRYINRIELPLPMRDFRDYILTGPQIADNVPSGVSELFFRVVIPKPDDDGIYAIVTSTMAKPEQEGKILPYIFDIDAFTAVELPADSNEIWSILERLRDYKNLIFFASTTERAKELFR